MSPRSFAGRSKNKWKVSVPQQLYLIHHQEVGAGLKVKKKSAVRGKEQSRDPKREEQSRDLKRARRSLIMRKDEP